MAGCNERAIRSGSRLCARSTALMRAAQNGRTRVVELLIAAGANVAAIDNDRYGPEGSKL
jgi:ankyrin repeat protein